MVLKPVVNVKCPCCQHVLEVDVEKECVVSWRKGQHLKDDAKEGEDVMDVALRNQRDSKSRIEKEFLSAQENMKNQKQRLDELFKQATQKAKEQKDEPSDPFKGGKIWD
jgi:hypothetical protein